MKRCSTEAWARCPDRSNCEKNAEYVEGSLCDTFNLNVSRQQNEEPELVRPILWRSIEDPPQDYQHVIGWPEEGTYPFPQARECYTTGRAPWAYFPGIGAQYRISHWAEMPAGPTKKGTRK